MKKKSEKIPPLYAHLLKLYQKKEVVIKIRPKEILKPLTSPAVARRIRTQLAPLFDTK